MSAKPVYFAGADEFRRWLAKHHAAETELLVGFHKKATGRPTMTWQESVAEALCYGWIDGVRRRVDDDRYTIRFTPRTARSTWSSVNVRTMEQLIAEGRAQPAGVTAFEARRPADATRYSYEQRHEIELAPQILRAFRANTGAWKFFETQPAGYQRLVKYYIMSARKPETRARRLEQVIACSANGERLPQFRRT